MSGEPITTQDYTPNATLQGVYGWPLLLHLAPWMRRKVWTLDSVVARPPDEAFDGKHAMVIEGCHYVSSGRLSGGVPKIHKVEAGYVTDGLSIPRVGWLTIAHPFNGRLLAAGLVHDVQCDIAVALWNAGEKAAGRKMRAYADALFQEMLEWAGAGRWLHWRMRAGVSAWGLLRYGAWPMRAAGKREKGRGQKGSGAPWVN
jgi:hypothetical protein